MHVIKFSRRIPANASHTDYTFPKELIRSVQPGGSGVRIDRTLLFAPIACLTDSANALQANSYPIPSFIASSPKYSCSAISVLCKERPEGTSALRVQDQRTRVRFPVGAGTACSPARPQ